MKTVVVSVCLLERIWYAVITENHRTQTAYDDALIIKLFAFQFANSYASCFYIAFFRGVSTTYLLLLDKLINFSWSKPKTRT